MTHRDFLLMALLACATCLPASAESDDSSGRDPKSLTDRDYEVGFTFGLEYDGVSLIPDMGGALEFSAKYDDRYKITFETSSDGKNLELDKASLRYRLDRTDLTLEYRKPRPFADSLRPSEDKPFFGSSLSAKAIDDAGYAARSYAFRAEWDSPKNSPIEAAEIGVSYDGAFVAQLLPSIAFRLQDGDSWIGLSGSFAFPALSGYGTAFAYADLRSISIYAAISGGTYLGALDALADNGALYEYPIWGHAELDCRWRVFGQDSPLDAWLATGVGFPAMAISDSIDFTGLAGIAFRPETPFEARLLGGVDLSYEGAGVRVAPDIRLEIKCAI